MVGLLVSEGRFDEALERGDAMLDEAIGKLGLANESIRYAWPDMLEAALELGRIDRARELVTLLADEPPGHVPPFLRSQLARGRALTNAAAGDHDAVEAGLTAAIDGFRSLGYPYWLAEAQLDLAALAAEPGAGRRVGAAAGGGDRRARAAGGGAGAEPCPRAAGVARRRARKLTSPVSQANRRGRERRGPRRAPRRPRAGCASRA